MIWGLVNCFHAQTQRLDRALDRIEPELRDLQRAQDGTEIKSRELEMLTDRAHNMADRRDALEIFRDCAADAYRARTGDVWRPRHGSHASRTGSLTSAAIDARDFMRARKDRKTQAHLPEGTLVAIAGGKDVQDPAAVIARLDKAREKYADMVLVHGGGPGVEKVAASWAERNGIHQVVCKPDWDRHGRAVPFRRNDELLNLLPKGVIAFPGSGITENLVDKARQLGIPVLRCAAARFRVRTPMARRRHPRARFAPRSSPRFARPAPATPIASLAALVQALLRSPAALRPALSRALRAASPSAQSPRRLPSAVFAGVDFPIARSAGFGRPDRPGRPRFSHPTHR